MPEETIYQNMKRKGVSRRDFLKLSGLFAAALGFTRMPPLEESGLPASLNVHPKRQNRSSAPWRPSPACRSSGWSFRIAPDAAKRLPVPTHPA